MRHTLASENWGLRIHTSLRQHKNLSIKQQLINAIRLNYKMLWVTDGDIPTRQFFERAASCWPLIGINWLQAKLQICAWLCTVRSEREMFPARIRLQSRDFCEVFNGKFAWWVGSVGGSNWIKSGLECESQFAGSF